MRVVTELGTEGEYVFFGKTKLDLDYKGITVIQARNLDARKDASATNAAGKSLLLGMLPEIVYDAVPSGKDISSQKEINKQGYFEIKHKGDKYRVERSWGAKKTFKIFKNGKDIKVRTLADAGSKLKQLFGLTEEEFYSIAYIDVNRPHPLIRGSSAQRQSYFTSLFRLHDTDALRKLLLQELRECEKAGAVYKELVQQYKDIRGTTSVKLLKKLEAQSVGLKAQARDYTKVSEELQSLNELIEFKERYADLISSLQKMKVGPEDIAEQLKIRQARAKVLDKMLDQAREYRAERKTIEIAKIKVKKIEEKLKIFGLTTDIEKARKGKKLLAKYRPKLDTTESEIRSILKTQTELDQKLHELKHVENESLADSNEVKAKKRREAELEHELEHSKKFGAGKCPTCGSTVKARPIEDIRQELKKVRSRLSYWADIESRHSLVKQNKEVLLQRTELDRLRSKLASKVSKYEKYAAAYEKLIARPEVPKATVSKPEFEVEDLKTQIEKNTRRLTILERAEPVVDILRKALSLTDKHTKRVEDLKSQAKELEAASAKLIGVESRIETEREKLKSLQRMKDKALALKDQTSDIPVIKTLLEVYSNKGLKKLMIQRYAQVIEDQLNKFRSVLFSENLTFEIKYDSKLHILCHRHYGKRVKTSDVRRLSGAEGRAFVLLLLLATLTLIPKSRRLNFLVLDEADSNMGPDQFQNFLRFIPILNKVIPHIVILTPKKDVVYEGARVFTVVKKDGRSKLVKEALCVA
jgi:DNA repair exonuclease SbcCD ATPase subunit